MGGSAPEPPPPPPTQDGPVSPVRPGAVQAQVGRGRGGGCRAGAATGSVFEAVRVFLPHTL